MFERGACTKAVQKTTGKEEDTKKNCETSRPVNLGLRQTTVSRAERNCIKYNEKQDLARDKSLEGGREVTTRHAKKTGKIGPEREHYRDKQKREVRGRAPPPVDKAEGRIRDVTV